MSRHTMLRTVWLIGVLLLIGLLAACGGQPAPAPTAAPTAAAPTQPPATVAPTDTAAPPTPTLAPPTATTAPTSAPTIAPTTVPTKAPTTAPTAAPVASADNCVKCHTSEETLQKLAKAEEPTEKLSEGEG